MDRLVVGTLILTLILTPMFGAKIPRQAPELAFELPSGQKVELGQYKGKVIALEFLLTTCPHCKRTAGVMQKLFGEYGSKKFQPLGVAMFAEPVNAAALQQVTQYANEARVTYPVGGIHRDRAVDFLQHPIMLTLWVPQLVFIDKSGTIVAQYAGTDKFFRNEEVNIRAVLDKLLAE